MKFGDTIFGQRRRVAYLAATILFIARFHLDNGAILDVERAENNNLECERQCLVGAPMCGQRCTEDVWTAGAHQIIATAAAAVAGVIRAQHIVQQLVTAQLLRT